MSTNNEDDLKDDIPTEFKKVGLDKNIYGNRNPKRKKTKIKTILIGFIFLLLILLIGGSIIVYKNQISAIDLNSDEAVYFSVAENETSSDLAKKLVDKGLIRNEKILKIYFKLNKINHYTEGHYKASKKDDLKRIVEMIVNGEVDNTEITFQILEGRNIRQIAKKIKEVFDIPEEEVFNTLKDEKYIDQLIKDYWFLTKDIKDKRIYYPLEGYLFPDTYRFLANGTTVKIIFEKLLDRMEEILEPYKKFYVNADGSLIKNPSKMPIHQELTLASIAELEGAGSEYREEIVGVFINRLQNGMNIGSDPTTLYAFKINLGEKELTQVQIDTENPYNTRGPNMIGKLPVGPICSPSKTSIDAAFNYKKTNNKFFVSDKEGTLYFTKTYDDHVNKINELKNKGMWFVVED